MGTITLVDSRYRAGGIALCLVLALVGCSAGGAAGARGLSSAERDWLAAHGPVKFAPDPGYPPFESVDATGNVTGINVDFLNRMSRNLGFDYQIVLYPNWTAVLDAMRAGEVDVLGSVGRTAEREEYMTFVGPYMQVGEVFYIRGDGSQFETPADLAGHTVGVIQDYAAATWLADNRPDVTLVPFADMESGLNALSVGDVDAFFENIPVGGYYIRQNALTNIRILGEPAYFSEANWAVPKNGTMLASIISTGMDSIPLGEQTRVFEYWTGYDLGVARSPTATGLSPMARNTILGIAGVALAAVVWSFGLRRTVQARTRELRTVNEQLKTDNQHRRAAEEEVRRLNEDLESRVSARTADLAALNEDLETFTYTVSHDLRSPLTALRSYATVLSSQESGLDADGKRYLDRMIAATQRMGRLLDDVLKLARATRRELVLANVDLSTLAKESLESLRAGDPERKVDVTIQEGAVVRGDQDLLHVVIDNLLGNAWKYTQRRQDAKIAFGWTDTPEGRVFHVADNGAGFDPAKSGQLFRPFARLHEDKEFVGTGVGLATVARIVERHGGRVWADSKLGEGATFHFTNGDAIT